MMRTAPTKARPAVAGAMRMANSQRLADPVGQMLDKVGGWLLCQGKRSDPANGRTELNVPKGCRPAVGFPLIGPIFSNAHQYFFSSQYWILSSAPLGPIRRYE